MAAQNTVNGSSGGHGLYALLGERLHDGHGATACAVLASCQVQGHDGPFDACWRLGRVALGSFRLFLSPGGILGIVATPPFVEPTFRTGQLSTDVLDLVFGKVVVDGVVTTVCCVLGHGDFLWKVMRRSQGYHWFSMVWHN